MTTHYDDLSDEKRAEISDYATLSESAYRRTYRDRKKFIDQHALETDRYVVDPTYKSRNHTLVYDKHKDRYIFSIAGTDINASVSKSQRTEDLFTDAVLASLGTDALQLLPRYKQSVRELTKAQVIAGDKPLVITGHSLGAQIGRLLTVQTGLESHTFNPGSSPISTFKDVKASLLRKDVRDRLKNNHSYFVHDTGSVDILSHSDSLNPFTNNYIYRLKRGSDGKIHKHVKQSVLPGHSAHNFIQDPEWIQETVAPNMVKKTRKRYAKQ